MNTKQSSDSRRDANGAWLIAIGTALGSVLGAAFDNVAVGMALGIGLGGAAYSLYAALSDRI